MGIEPAAIRRAAPGDAEAIARLVAQLGYPDNDAAQVAARLPVLSAAGGAAFVAVGDARVIGCLTTSLLHVLHRPAPVGRISMMVVDEEWRGTGVGRALVAAAEVWMREHGCTIAEVTSRTERIAAHRFYETLGYEKTSVRLWREL